MTPAVRILRVALPIIFVGFVVLIVLSFTANERKDEESGEPAAGLRRNERPQRIGEQFEGVQTIGGRTVLRIKAQRTVGFESGWYTLEDVELTVYRAGGQTYEVTSAQAQVHAESKELEATEGVRLRSADGLEISTESLRFDGSELIGREPLDFRMRTWQGRAGALQLNVREETVRLTGGVDAATPANEDMPATALRADRADFNRATGEVLLEGSVQVKRALDSFQSDRATVRVDLATDRIRSINGEGNARVLMPRGAEGSDSGAVTVRADRFAGEFDPQGQLAAVQALGAPARADLTGPPARTITAPSFRMHMPGGQLTEIQGTGGVRVVEQVPGGNLRQIDAQTASAILNPATREVTTVQAQGGVRIRDAQVAGEGDRAVWDLALQRIILTSAPPRLPTLTTPEQVLRASRLDISLSGSTLTAEGQVYASMRSAGADNAVFQSSGPVFVNAESGVFSRSNNTALFQGNVRAWQGSDTLLANELRITHETGVVTAAGNVRTQLTQRTNAGGAGPGMIRTSSRTLVARRNDNRIELEGDVTVNEQGRVVQSDEAVVLVDGNGTLRRVEASGNLTLAEAATGRKGAGSRAVYEPGKNTIILDGEPARISDARGEVRGRQILFDLGKNRVEVLSGSEPTEATYNPPA